MINVLAGIEYLQEWIGKVKWSDVIRPGHPDAGDPRYAYSPHTTLEEDKVLHLAYWKYRESSTDHARRREDLKREVDPMAEFSAAIRKIKRGAR